MQEVVDMFFDRVKNLLNKTRLSEALHLLSRLWNVDETTFCTVIASKALLTRCGAIEVHKTARGSRREYITVLGMLNKLIESLKKSDCLPSAQLCIIEVYVYCLVDSIAVHYTREYTYCFYFL